MLHKKIKTWSLYESAVDVYTSDSGVTRVG